MSDTDSIYRRYYRYLTGGGVSGGPGWGIWSPGWGIWSPGWGICRRLSPDALGYLCNSMTTQQYKVDTNDPPPETPRGICISRAPPAHVSTHNRDPDPPPGPVYHRVSPCITVCITPPPNFVLTPLRCPGPIRPASTLNRSPTRFRVDRHRSPPGSTPAAPGLPSVLLLYHVYHHF